MRPNLLCFWWGFLIKFVFLYLVFEILIKEEQMRVFFFNCLIGCIQLNIFKKSGFLYLIDTDIKLNVVSGPMVIGPEFLLNLSKKGKYDESLLSS